MFIQKPIVPSTRSPETHSACVSSLEYSLSDAGLVNRSAHVQVPYEPVSIQRMSFSQSSNDVWT
jgi:hypothetical protein